jgi:hypothetical protein
MKCQGAPSVPGLLNECIEMPLDCTRTSDYRAVGQGSQSGTGGSALTGAVLITAMAANIISAIRIVFFMLSFSLNSWLVSTTSTILFYCIFRYFGRTIPLYWGK